MPVLTQNSDITVNIFLKNGPYEMPKKNFVNI